MRKGLLSFLALILVAATDSAVAQQPQLALGVRSLGEVRRELLHIAGRVLGPVGRGAATALLQQLDERGVFEAIDPDRPAGLYVTVTEKGGFEPPVLFVPIRSAEAVQRWVKSLDGLRLEAMEEGLWRLSGRGRSGYVRFAEGYAFVSWTPEAIDEPVHPDAFGIQHDCQLVIRVAELPEAVKTAITDRIVARAACRHARRCNSEACAELRERSRAAIRELIEQVESITVAAATDRQEGKFAFELEIKAKPGTELADRIVSTGEVLSRLPVLARGADFYLQSSFVIPEECFELARARLEECAARVSEHLRERKGQRVEPSEILKVLEAVCGQPIVDVAVAADYQGKGQGTVVVAAKVADTATLREAFGQCARRSGISVQVSGDLYGTPLYHIRHKVRHKGKEKTITAVVWFGREYVWCAIGQNAAARLSRAVRSVYEGETRESRGVVLRVDLRAVAQAIADTRGDKRAERALAAIGDKPLICTVNAHPMGRTIVLRTEVDDRIAAAIAAAAVGDASRARFLRRFQHMHHRRRPPADGKQDD